MNEDYRGQLYQNLIGSKKVTEKEIGTLDDFKSAITDETSAREFHSNLINSGKFTEDEIGNADDFYGSIAEDFKVKPEADAPGTGAAVGTANNDSGVQTQPVQQKVAEPVDAQTGAAVPLNRAPYKEPAEQTYPNGAAANDGGKRDWIATKNPYHPYVKMAVDKESGETFYVDYYTGEPVASIRQMPEQEMSSWNFKDAFSGKSFTQQADDALKAKYGAGYKNQTFTDENGNRISGEDMWDSYSTNLMSNFYQKMNESVLSDDNRSKIENLVGDAIAKEEKRSGEIASKEIESQKMSTSEMYIPSKEAHFDPAKFADNLDEMKKEILSGAEAHIKKIAEETGVKEEFIRKHIKDYVEGTVAQKTAEFYEAKYGVHSDAEFVVIGALEGSLIGKLARTNVPDAAKNIREEYMQGYAQNAGSLANLSQFGLTLLADTPFFAAFGGVSGFVTRGLPEWKSAGKIIDALVEKGLSREAAMSTYKAMYATHIGTRLTNDILKRVASSALTLGQYEGMGSVLDGGNYFTGTTVIDPKTKKPLIDKETGKEVKQGGFWHGAKLGTAFGIVNHVAHGLTYGLEGGAKVLGFAGSLTGEAATLTAMDNIDAYISGKKNIGDFLFETAENLPQAFVMRYANGEIFRNIQKLKENVKNGFRNVDNPLELNADNYQELKERGFDLSEMYVEPMNTRFYREGAKTDEAKANRMLSEVLYKTILADPNISLATKHKVEYLFGGKMTYASADEIRYERTSAGNGLVKAGERLPYNDGRIKVTTYNGRDEVMSVKYFATEEEASRFEQQLDRKFEADKANADIAKVVVADIVQRGRATEDEVSEILTKGYIEKDGKYDTKRTKEVADELTATTNRLVKGIKPILQAKAFHDAQEEEVEEGAPNLAQEEMGDEQPREWKGDGLWTTDENGQHIFMIRDGNGGYKTYVPTEQDRNGERDDGGFQRAIISIDGNPVEMLVKSGVIEMTADGRVDKARTSDVLYFVDAEGAVHPIAKEKLNVVGLEPELTAEEYFASKGSEIGMVGQSPSPAAGENDQLLRRDDGEAAETPLLHETGKELHAEWHSNETGDDGKGTLLIKDGQNEDGTYNVVVYDETTGETDTVRLSAEDINAMVTDEPTVAVQPPSSAAEGNAEGVGTPAEGEGAGMQPPSSAAEGAPVEAAAPVEERTPAQQTYDTLMQQRKGNKAGVKSDVEFTLNSLNEQKKQLAQKKKDIEKKLEQPVNLTLENPYAQHEKWNQQLEQVNQQMAAVEENIGKWTDVKNVYYLQEQAELAERLAQEEAARKAAKEKEDAERKAAEEAFEKRRQEEIARRKASEEIAQKAMLLPEGIGKPRDVHEEANLDNKTVPEAIKYLNTRFNLGGAYKFIMMKLGSAQGDKARTDFWKAVQAEQERITTPRDTEQEVDVDLDKPATGDEIITALDEGTLSPVAAAAWKLLGGNLNRDSFISETGFGVHDFDGYVGMFRKGDAGQTLASVAHYLWENHGNIFESDQDARNAIIEAVQGARTKGELKGIINDEVVALRENTAAEKMWEENARRQWVAEQAGFDSYDDYIAAEEQAVPDIIRKEEDTLAEQRERESLYTPIKKEGASKAGLIRRSSEFRNDVEGRKEDVQKIVDAIRDEQKSTPEVTMITSEEDINNIAFELGDPMLRDDLQDGLDAGAGGFYHQESGRIFLYPKAIATEGEIRIVVSHENVHGATMTIGTDTPRTAALIYDLMPRDFAEAEEITKNELYKDATRQEMADEIVAHTFDSYIAEGRTPVVGESAEAAELLDTFNQITDYINNGRSNQEAGQNRTLPVRGQESERGLGEYRTDSKSATRAAGGRPPRPRVGESPRDYAHRLAERNSRERDLVEAQDLAARNGRFAIFPNADTTDAANREAWEKAKYSQANPNSVVLMKDGGRFITFGSDARKVARDLGMEDRMNDGKLTITMGDYLKLKDMKRDDSYGIKAEHWSDWEEWQHGTPDAAWKGGKVGKKNTHELLKDHPELQRERELIKNAKTAEEQVEAIDDYVQTLSDMLDGEREDLTIMQGGRATMLEAISEANDMREKAEGAGAPAEAMFGIESWKPKAKPSGTVAKAKRTPKSAGEKTQKEWQATAPSDEKMLQRPGEESMGEYYDDDNQALAHAVKRGEKGAIKEAARRMALWFNAWYDGETVRYAEDIGNNYSTYQWILVPVPGHGGKATYTKKLAEEISKITGIPVADALTAKPHKSAYESKAQGEQRDKIEPSVNWDAIKAAIDSKERKSVLTKNPHPVLIDNVRATGETLDIYHDALSNKTEQKKAGLDDLNGVYRLTLTEDNSNAWQIGGKDVLLSGEETWQAHAASRTLPVHPWTYFDNYTKRQELEKRFDNGEITEEEYEDLYEGFLTDDYDSGVSVDDGWVVFNGYDGKPGTAVDPEELKATHDNPWQNVQEATVHSSNIRKRYPQLHESAKHGDVMDAYRLVDKVADDKKIAQLQAKYPEAIVAYPHAEDRRGRNAIPSAFADKFADAGFEVDEDIVQTNRVYRTDANKFDRLIKRARFDGEVQAGREYILIDDHITSGATMRDMKDYIESKGGKVVAVQALEGSAGATKMAITPELKEQLINNGVTDEQLKELGISRSVENLTAGEARELLTLSKRGRDFRTKEQQKISSRRNAKNTRRGKEEIAGAEGSRADSERARVEAEKQSFDRLFGGVEQEATDETADLEAKNSSKAIAERILQRMQVPEEKKEQVKTGVYQPKATAVGKKKAKPTAWVQLELDFKDEEEPKAKPSGTVAEAAEGVGTPAARETVGEPSGKAEGTVAAEKTPEDFRLRPLKEGETCLVERRYTESGSFGFTGSEKIESPDDVAYIFRNLEDSAIENAFFALVKNGKTTIIHAGMGAMAFSATDHIAPVMAIDNINPDAVFFIHNHPSGTLTPSRDDKMLYTALKDMYGDKLQDGIIIDQKSGKYSTFDAGGFISKRVRPTSSTSEVSYKTYSFSKNVFAPDYSFNDGIIADASDIAAFVSSHRLGDRGKLGVLICSNNLHINGNILLDVNEITDKNYYQVAKDIVSASVAMSGKAVFVHGSGGLTFRIADMLNIAIRNLSGRQVSLKDVITMNGNNEDSMRSVYAQEPEAEYGNATNDKKVADLEKKLAENLQKYGKSATFAPDNEEMQQLFSDWATLNNDKLLETYYSNHPNLVDPDEVRKLFEPLGYDGSNVVAFKRAAKPITNKIFKQLCKKAKREGNPTMTMLSGAPGSGKSFATSTMKADLDKRGVVYDRPFNTFADIEQAIKQARSNGIKDVQVIAVYNDAEQAWKNCLSRGKRAKNGVSRFVPYDFFIRSFADNAGKIAELAEKYPDVDIVCIDNSGNQRKVVSIEDAKAWNYDVTEELKDRLIDILLNDKEISDERKQQVLYEGQEWKGSLGQRGNIEASQGVNGTTRRNGAPYGQEVLGRGASDDVQRGLRSEISDERKQQIFTEGAAEVGQKGVSGQLDEISGRGQGALGRGSSDEVQRGLHSEIEKLRREAEEESSPLRKMILEAKARNLYNEVIAKAEGETELNPTDAQKEAGNYKKGHLRIDGYDISIENPKGSTRSGKDADGKAWSVTMHNTYGYIRGTEGVDGDHIDIYLSDDPYSGNVFVIDQVNADGSFDEHKVMYGFDTAEEARENYLANYSEGWTGLGTITEVTKEEFQKWVKSSHRKTKPFAEYKSVKTERTQHAEIGGRERSGRFATLPSSKPFYSNAAKAVEDIKQQKATPEQWLKMIEKNGGLKRGEDKWMGLSDWLKERAKLGAKTLSKDEVMEYIRQNTIEIEEVEYGDYEGLGINTEDEGYDNPQEAFDYMLEQGFTPEEAIDEMREIYNYDFKLTDDGELDIPQHLRNARPINETRLRYTTKGLENKKEIALTVPNIEPYYKSDEVHFGDAGDGRAVAWARFGDATELSETLRSYYELEKKYGEGNLYRNPEMTPEEIAIRDKGVEEILHSADNRKKVLVIDEIQSRRHQDGREQGYFTPEMREAAKRDYESLRAELESNRKEILDLMENPDIPDGLKDGNPDYYRLYEDEIPKELYKQIEDAYAKEDEIRAKLREINAFRGVPDAPFDKNWHELAMKRMLRYAAENGYDKVAWTTGAQQAARYNIGGVVPFVDVTTDPHPAADERARWKTLRFSANGNACRVDLNTDGKVILAEGLGNDAEGKDVKELFGREVGEMILQSTNKGGFPDRIQLEGVEIGGEGMKGFYDQMLPKFMQKYGKKWGAKVGEVELDLPNSADRKMWSVDVTPEMRESVRRGQPMFYIAPDAGSLGADWEDPEIERNKMTYLQRLDEAKNEANQVLTRLGGVELSAQAEDADRKNKLLKPEQQSEARKAVAKFVNAALSTDNMSVFSKRALKAISSKVAEAKTTRMLRKHLMEAETICNDAEVARLKMQIDKLLKMKVQDMNDKGISVGKLVDDETRKVFEYMKGRTEELRRTEVDDELKAVGAELREIEKIIKEALYEYGIGDAADRDERNAMVDANPSLTTEYDGEERTLAELKAMTEPLIEQQKELKEQKAEIQADNRDNLANWHDRLNELQYRFEKAGDEGAKDVKPLSDSEKREYEGLMILDVINEADKLAYTTQVREDGQLQESVKSIQDKKKELFEKNRQLRLQLGENHGRDDMYIKMEINKNNNLIDNLTLAENAIKEQQIDFYRQAADAMKELIQNGMSKLMEQKEAEKERKDYIGIKAYRDVKKGNEWGEGQKQKTTANTVKDFFFLTPLQSFEFMSQWVSNMPAGRGFLYNYFTKNLIKAEEELASSMDRDTEVLNQKCQELFGCSFKQASERYGRSPWHPFRKYDSGIYVMSEDGSSMVKDDRYTDIPKGTALQFWMWWQNPDGKMKMQAMGFNEESIQQIEQYCGPKLLEFGQWLFGFYNDMGDRVNEVHKLIYNTSMHRVPNYSPLKINDTAISEKNDLAAGDNAFSKNLNKTNGSLINRTVNMLPLSTERTAFDIVAEHMNANEELIAFGRVRKDLDYLLNSSAFRNTLNANKAGNYNDFVNAALVAAHLTRENFVGGDKVYGAIMSGFAAGAIGYRIWTGIKQVMSYPAFYAYKANPRYWADVTARFWSILEAKPTLIMANIHWASENLPLFKARWNEGLAGNQDIVREVEALDNQTMWGRIREKYGKYGMLWNRFVDAMTCAAGARAIYDFEYRRRKKHYIACGRTEERAHELANRQALEAANNYNTTQQSSVKTYVSPDQDSKTALNRVVSLFQNSNRGFSRQGYLGAKDLLGAMSGKKRAYWVQRYMEDNAISEAEANKMLAEDVATAACKFAMCGFGIKWIWDRTPKIGKAAMLAGMTPAAPILGGAVAGTMVGASVGSKAKSPFVGAVGGGAAGGALGFALGGSALAAAISAFLSTILEDDDEASSENNGKVMELLNEGAKWASYFPQGTVGGNIAHDWLWNNSIYDPFSIVGQSESESIKKAYDKYGWSPEVSAEIMRRLPAIQGFNMDTYTNIYIGVKDLIDEGVKAHVAIDVMLMLNCPASMRKDVASTMYKDYSLQEYTSAMVKARKLADRGRFLGQFTGSRDVKDKDIQELTEEWQKNKVGADVIANFNELNKQDGLLHLIGQYQAGVDSKSGNSGMSESEMDDFEKAHPELFKLIPSETGVSYQDHVAKLRTVYNKMKSNMENARKLGDQNLYEDIAIKQSRVMKEIVEAVNGKATLTSDSVDTMLDDQIDIAEGLKERKDEAENR